MYIAGSNSKERLTDLQAKYQNGEMKVCVECGSNTPSKKLFRKFQGGAIRLLFCDNCFQVLDKYLEYDAVLVFLDILLHKPQAYRHVLINRQPQIHWQLCMAYLLSNAYTQWSYMYKPTNKYSTTSHHDHSVLEMEFYFMLWLACLELCAYFIGIFTAVRVFSVISTKCKEKPFRDVVKAVLLASFGNLLVVPVFVWAQPSVQIVLWLIRILVFTSTAEALKVILKTDFIRASLITAFGSLAEGACKLGVPYILGNAILHNT